jgi:23S rRNA (cytosine1962-C5)-methyltransferase
VTDIELADAGGGRRLERFGTHLVDRPAPTAIDWKVDPDAWAAADLRFDPGPGWTADRAPIEPAAIEPWTVSIDGLTMELRPTASGGVGLYPEHATNLAWLAARIGERLGPRAHEGERAPRGPSTTPDDRARPLVLNLFAHTGLVTLAAARAGAAVAHLDAARSPVAWARRNAELSGLADRPIRWLVDDAAGFVAREARRGRRYDGIVLDPPSFGHAKGRRWRLADELPALLAACRAIAADHAFLLLTAHTTGLDGTVLEDLVRETAPMHARVERSMLRLDARSGAQLDLGWAVRLAP